MISLQFMSNLVSVHLWCVCRGGIGYHCVAVTVPTGRLCIICLCFSTGNSFFALLNRWLLCSVLLCVSAQLLCFCSEWQRPTAHPRSSKNTQDRAYLNSQWFKISGIMEITVIIRMICWMPKYGILKSSISWDGIVNSTWEGILEPAVNSTCLPFGSAQHQS